MPAEEVHHVLVGALNRGEGVLSCRQPAWLEELGLHEPHQVSTKKLTSQLLSSSSWKSLAASSGGKSFSILSMIRSFFAFASGLLGLMAILPVNVKSSTGFQTPSAWNTSWTSFGNADSDDHWSHMMGTATLATAHSFPGSAMRLPSSRRP